MKSVQIQKIQNVLRTKALALVWETFLQYEAPDYSREGIETFQNSVINNEDYLNAIEMYGAFEGDSILGIIATRNEGSHIALFFVDGKFQRRGIGKQLFQAILENSTTNEITVNSSPFAIEVYHRLGFVDTAPEQMTDGMRYIPMRYKK
ncbi:hypothetical protein CLNEO_17320 [Anaerotignum neopropionicum]|uniref:N-acetyltransferase domain-containing protein n=1 Tax=Anaerotignum neopropionicum TaxID=36847 RepID=A0A136WE14_9FIRM|nr:GNAT family N-acetyltransferase [Anaerotignum neopropionicum]KXL52711.1 hypothetical protein CLNEO_17320 [Anaerotignum neopropionicum]